MALIISKNLQKIKADSLRCRLLFLLICKSNIINQAEFQAMIHRV